MRAVLLASAATAAFFGAEPAWAQPENPLAAQNRAARLSVPLLFDGSYRGDVTITADGSHVAVWVDQFIALLGGQIAPAQIARIRAEADSPVAIDIERLRAMGIAVEFDSAALELHVSIPLASQGRQRLAAETPVEADERDFLKPSPVAASATFYLTQNYAWDGRNQQRGFQPIQATADLAAALGGKGGVFAFSQHSYNGTTHRLERGNSQLVFDLPDHAIRMTLGDLAPLPTGFQTSPLVGGFTLQRAWSELQPLRNIRPSGQAQFVLDRPATIDVVVNGAVVRSMQLQPGNFDLSKLPYANGLNAVELYVQDDQGRRLLTSFSQFYTAQLLAGGLSDFALTAGFLENTGGTGTRYRGNAPAVSGWYRAGITDRLTMGANVQIGADMVMVGAEAVAATRFGVFSALGSLSRAQERGGRAILLGYENQLGNFGPLRQVRFNADWRATSRDFAQLDHLFSNPVRSQIQARLTGNVRGGWSGGLSYARYNGRDSEATRESLALQVRRSFRRFDLSASFDRQTSSQGPRNDRVLLTATMQLGRTQSLRSTFDTTGHAGRIEYARFAREEQDTLGIIAGLERSDNGTNVSGEGTYNGSLLRLGLSHRLFQSPGQVFSQETQYVVSTQVATTGGSLAIGRPVGPRFAIVSAHPTMDEARLAVSDGAVRQHPLARATVGRPGLVALGAPYVASRIKVDVDRLPMGYDIGPGEYRMKPGPVAGYAVTVGSDATHVVMGVALDAQGNPLAQMGGTLVSLDHPEAAPILVFTNRNGRFVATGLAPGRYELRIGNEGAWRQQIVVPRKGAPTIALGSLQLSARKVSR